MIRYILKRVLWLIPVMIVVSFIVFTLMELTPGSVIDGMITDGMTSENIEALREKYGLDKPMIYRFGVYMIGLLRGDLGVSAITGLSVWDTYLTRLPNTLILAFSSLVFGAGIGIPLGIVAARRAGTLADNATTVFSLAGMSMPPFWLALLLLLLFALRLQWLPTAGNRDGFRSIILPTVCIGLQLLATCTRQTRSSMLEVLRSDYLRTARAKGVPERVVIRKHALGNAWIPILTTIGTTFAITIAGSAVMESVFAWPGIGRAIVEAVISRDAPLLTGFVILTTFMYVMIMLIIDLLYALVDPRIRSKFIHSKKKKRQTPEQTLRKDNPQKAPAEIPPMPILASVTTNIDEVADSCSNADECIDAQDKATFVTPETDYSFQTVTESDIEKAQSYIYSDKTKDMKTGESYKSAVDKYKKHGKMGEIMHRMKKNKGAMAGLVILVFIFLIFLASLFISFEAVTESNIKMRLSAPSLQFPFGTDHLGRNLLLRVIFGTRYSLAIGFGVVIIGLIFGTFFGSIAGYYGGKTDDLIMRASDVLASLPAMLLGMVILTVMGQSLMSLIIAAGFPTIPRYLRITRASVLTIKDSEFVEAARSIGFGNARIIFSQILPNGLSPIIITTTLSMGTAISIAAAFSFLGFGIPAPHPEWGALISGGREFARNAPWLTSFPGVAIMLIVLALNMLGDGLRDALDPKLKV